MEILKAGGVIVFPTETSYGIGCDATNRKAVRRVFQIKGRPSGKGTPLIVESLAVAERWGLFSPVAKRLAKNYWPGALTLVVPVASPLLLKEGQGVVGIVSSVLQNRTVALRVSGHPVARALAKGLGRPLVATSANLSGQPPAFSVRALSALLASTRSSPPLTKGRLGGVYVLDVGALPRRRPTTLVKVVGDRTDVLRQGTIRL